MKRYFWPLLLALVPGLAQAGAWQKCDLTVQVVGKENQKIQAKVTQVKAKLGLECPIVDSLIAFTPETKDWQNTLPKKQWPRVGQTWKVRYQYLDGICKNDGHEKACRIEHYPVN